MCRLYGIVCVLFRTHLMKDASYFSSYIWPYSWWKSCYLVKFSYWAFTKSSGRRCRPFSTILQVNVLNVYSGPGSAKNLKLAAYQNLKLLSRKCKIKTKECRTNKYAQTIKNPFTVEQNTVCTEKFTAPVNRLASKKYSNWLRFIAATRHAQGLFFCFLVG